MRAITRRRCFWSARLVVVIRDGLVEDVYADVESDVQLLILDHDARQFAEDDDHQVSQLDGDRVWITNYEVVVNPWFVSRVFRSWE